MRPSSIVIAAGRDAIVEDEPAADGLRPRSDRRRRMPWPVRRRPGRARQVRRLDVELDVEPVAVGRVARLGRLDAPAVAVDDDAPLDEQRVARPDPEQPGVLGRGRGGGDRAGPAAQDDAGPAQRLVERAVRQVGGHDRVRAGPDQDGRLERDRLVVGLAQAAQVDDRLVRSGCRGWRPPRPSTDG